MAKYVVAAAAEIPPGERKFVKAGGRPIVVFNLDGEFFALLDRCPHQGASLCEGYQTGCVTSEGPGSYVFDRQGEIIRCPWHGWEFDIRTGQSWFDPARTRVRKFETGVTQGSELVEGPYKAETFNVVLEEDYVVVEM